MDLALTVQRHSVYPGGHPSVDAAAEALQARVDGLLQQREVISVGIARRQLVAEGVATDASHPVLRALAERLHRHRLGAFSLRRGLDTAELRAALQAVAQDADRGDPLGTWPPEALAQWPHVGFYRVTYEQLQLSDAGDGSPAGGSGAVAQLWVGLAQAAVARSDGTTEPVDSDPDASEVARAINEHPGAVAYDQALVGYLLQLVDELRHDGDSAEGVRLRVSELIRHLEPGTLQRLLVMGGDTAQRARFLRYAADGLRPDAVLELVKAAARTQGESISTSMLRLLTKLSSLATVDSSDVSTPAGTQMREQVQSLLAGWSLADPNPDAYTQALEALSRTTSGEAHEGASENGAEPLRLVQLALEVGTPTTSFWRAVDTLIAEHRLRDLFAVLDAAEPSDEVAESLWHRLESTDHVRRALTTDPVDFESLDRIMERLPTGTVVSLLLDRIAESESRATRMAVFRRLAGRGAGAVPLVAERLGDERWYVQRNMLALLHEIGTWPKGFSALEYARHAHPAVRREALQLALSMPGERQQAIPLALADPDERAVRVGIAAAREHGLPATGVQAVLPRLDEPDLSPELRAGLIRIVGQHATPPVIQRLLAFVVHERRLLGPRLLPRSPEQAAAVAALAGMATDEARVRAALALAAASRDPVLRAAAARRPG